MESHRRMKMTNMKTNIISAEPTRIIDKSETKKLALEMKVVQKSRK